MKHRLALVVLCALLSACGTNGVGPDDGGGGMCTSDISCPEGTECGTGSCVPVAPGLYNHIQTASALFRDPLDAAEVTWRAAHYDLLINDVLDYADEFRAVNPNVRLFSYMYSRYMNYDQFGDRATQWANDHGVDVEDFYLHYREDVQLSDWNGITLVENFPPGEVPGWNPDPAPGDPIASATSRAQSRVPSYNPGGVAVENVWYMANINNQSYRAFLLDWATQVLRGSLDGHTIAGDPIDGIVFDNAIYYPEFNEGRLDKTDEYYGIPLDYNHPHALGFATLYPEITDGLARRYGRGVDIMPNFGHVLFLNYKDIAGTQVVETVPWIWAEVWLTCNGSDTPTGPSRAVSYDWDYKNAVMAMIHQTRGSGRRVLGVRDVTTTQEASDRAKIFSLAIYYLVHNVNTYYVYETNTIHTSPEHLSQWAWNPAVEFDIGQPDQIPQGTTDFEGNFPSNEHWVYATGPDPVKPELTYRVLARRFTNALVLVKMLPAGSAVTESSGTTHALDGSYAPLQADGTLGPVVTEVTLRNNEAAILIPVD